MPQHQEAKQHFERVVEQTQVCRHPFCHLVLRGVFPQIYFQRLLGVMRDVESNLKPIDGIGDHADRCRSLTGIAGYRSHHWLGASRHRLGSFLAGLVNWMGSAATARLLASKFPMSANISTTELRLVRETGASYLRPHLDRESKVLTGIVFLKGDDCSPGTALFRELQMEPVTTIAFEPNCAIFIPRTEDSWHGVQPQVLTGSRDTLHLYAYKQD